MWLFSPRNYDTCPRVEPIVEFMIFMKFYTLGSGVESILNHRCRNVIIGIYGDNGLIHIGYGLVEYSLLEFIVSLILVVPIKI